MTLHSAIIQQVPLAPGAAHSSRLSQCDCAKPARHNPPGWARTAPTWSPGRAPRAYLLLGSRAEALGGRVHGSRCRRLSRRGPPGRARHGPARGRSGSGRGAASTEGRHTPAAGIAPEPAPQPPQKGHPRLPFVPEEDKQSRNIPTTRRTPARPPSGLRIHQITPRADAYKYIFLFSPSGLCMAETNRPKLLLIAAIISVLRVALCRAEPKTSHPHWTGWGWFYSFRNRITRYGITGGKTQQIQNV